MASVVLLKLAHGDTQHTAHCNFVFSFSKVRADVTVAGRAMVCATIVHYVVHRLKRAFI